VGEALGNLLQLALQTVARPYHYQWKKKFGVINYNLSKIRIIKLSILSFGTVVASWFTPTNRRIT
jgi:hypothetical protein